MESKIATPFQSKSSILSLESFKITSRAKLFGLPMILVLVSYIIRYEGSWSLITFICHWKNYKIQRNCEKIIIGKKTSQKWKWILLKILG